MFAPNSEEVLQRDAVRTALAEAIHASVVVRLPDFVGTETGPTDTPLVGIEPNPFGGLVSEFRYQFEGEEDLLHLMIFRKDGQELSAEEGQAVAGFLLPNVPPALIYIKPGRHSQHFYFGHEWLL